MQQQTKSTSAAGEAFARWFSTYGLITADRVLETLHLKLPAEKMLVLLKNKDSFHYRLLQIPSLNLFNGLVHSQAKDYQVYAQKKLIDYLLSGEVAKDEDSPGSTTREKLETIREQMVDMGDDFEHLVERHCNFIASFQQQLNRVVALWQEQLKPVEQDVLSALKRSGVDLKYKQRAQIIHHIEFLASTHNAFDVVTDLTDMGYLMASKYHSKLSACHINTNAVDEQLNEINREQESRARQHSQEFISHRNAFKKSIYAINELMSQLPAPGYAEDEGKDAENRHNLDFYQQLGEEAN